MRFRFVYILAPLLLASCSSCSVENEVPSSKFKLAPIVRPENVFVVTNDLGVAVFEFFPEHNDVALLGYYELDGATFPMYFLERQKIVVMQEWRKNPNQNIVIHDLQANTVRSHNIPEGVPSRSCVAYNNGLIMGTKTTRLVPIDTLQGYYDPNEIQLRALEDEVWGETYDFYSEKYGLSTDYGRWYKNYFARTREILSDKNLASAISKTFFFDLDQEKVTREYNFDLWQQGKIFGDTIYGQIRSFSFAKIDLKTGYRKKVLFEADYPFVDIPPQPFDVSYTSEKINTGFAAHYFLVGKNIFGYFDPFATNGSLLDNGGNQTKAILEGYEPSTIYRFDQERNIITKVLTMDCGFILPLDDETFLAFEYKSDRVIRYNVKQKRIVAEHRFNLRNKDYAVMKASYTDTHIIMVLINTKNNDEGALAVVKKDFTGETYWGTQFDFGFSFVKDYSEISTAFYSTDKYNFRSKYY